MFLTSQSHASKGAVIPLFVRFGFFFCNIFKNIYQWFLVIFIIAVQDMLSAKIQAQVQAQLGGIPAKT